MIEYDIIWNTEKVWGGSFYVEAGFPKFIAALRARFPAKFAKEKNDDRL